MRVIPLCCTVLFFAVVVSAPQICSADPQPGYIEDWNIAGDLGEWRPNTTVTSVIVKNTGGNPGGYLQSSGNVSGSFDIGALTTTPQATGDYRAAVWTISIDVQFLAGSFDALWIRFRYKDFTENGWVYPLTETFPLGGWQTFTVTLNPGWSDDAARAQGWLTDRDAASPGASPSKSWNTTMSDVYYIEVRVSGEGFLRAGIDNVRLDKAPSAVVKPSYCPRDEYNSAGNLWTCYKD